GRVRQDVWRAHDGREPREKIRGNLSQVACSSRGSRFWRINRTLPGWSSVEVFEQLHDPLDTAHLPRLLGHRLRFGTGEQAHEINDPAFGDDLHAGGIEALESLDLQVARLHLARDHGVAGAGQERTGSRHGDLVVYPYYAGHSADMLLDARARLLR